MIYRQKKIHFRNRLDVEGKNKLINDRTELTILTFQIDRIFLVISPTTTTTTINLNNKNAINKDN